MDSNNKNIIIEQDNKDDFLVESKFKKQIDDLNRKKALKNNNDKLMKAQNIVDINGIKNKFIFFKKNHKENEDNVKINSNGFNLIKTLSGFIYIILVFSIILGLLILLIRKWRNVLNETKRNRCNCWLTKRRQIDDF